MQIKGSSRELEKESRGWGDGRITNIRMFENVMSKQRIS